MREFDHRIAFDLEYESADDARVIYRSVAQEVGEINDNRSETAVSVDETVIRISIEATDLVALRAAANTWLSLIEVAEETASLAK